MNDSTPAPPDPSWAPDEPTGTLIIRAWKSSDTGQLRARLIENGGDAPRTWATAAGVDAICEAVHAWLRKRPRG
jgi:hypothetical protein